MIVVTGATGNVGRPLIDALVSQRKRTTAVSRGDADLPAEVAHHKADLAKAETLKPAFERAEALFLLTPDPELDVVPVLDAARSAGIHRVVLLSSERAVTRLDESQRGVEHAVTESGLEWTILRPGGFASNALLWAESVRDERRIAAPFGDVALPVIDPLDIAEVAATTLTEHGHEGKAYLLKGPEPVTPREQTRAIAEAIGEAVEFVEQTPEEARRRLLQFWPEDIVEGSLAVIGNPNETERQFGSDVERVLGRAPRRFQDWAKRHANAFR